MDITNDLVSVGRLASDVRVSVPKLRGILEELGIEPVLRINGVEHFASDVADKVFHALHERNLDDGVPQVR